MSKKFLLWLVSVCCVVALAIVIVLSNSEPMSITLFPGVRFPKEGEGLNKGVMMLALFLSGVACTCLVGSYFGIKSYIHEWQMERREKRHQGVFQALTQARGLLAAGAWNEASDFWQQLLKRDSRDIISLVELAQCYEGAGKIDEAIKTIELARAEDSSNLEVLMYAAKLHEESGNLTVALDNLSLVLHHRKTEKVLKKACAIAEELGRIDEAVTYYQELQKLTNSLDKETEKRLLLKQILKNNRELENAEKIQNLRTFIRKYNSPQASLALFELLSDGQDHTEAAKVLAELAKTSGKMSYYQKLIKFWESKNEPSRALAAAKTALANTSGDENIKAKLSLINILLKQGAFNDSQITAFQDEFSTLINSNIPDLLRLNAVITKTILAHKLGQPTELGANLDELNKLLALNLEKD